MNVLVIQTDEHNFRTLGCYRELMPIDQAFVWGKGVKVDSPIFGEMTLNPEAISSVEFR